MLLWEQRRSNANNGTDVSFEQNQVLQDEDVIRLMKDFAEEKDTSVIVYSQHVDNKVLIWLITSSGEIVCEASELNLKESIKKGRTAVGITRNLALQHAICNNNRNIMSDFEGTRAMVEVSEKENGESDGEFDGESDGEKSMKDLYKVLIPPSIEDSLKEGERLIFVPFDDLFALPFAALIDSKGKYLIEKHIISFAPSIGTLLQLQQREHKHDQNISALIVGNPDNSLPNAEVEANKIYNLMEDNLENIFNGTKLINSQATRANVMDGMKGANIIHFSTHGSRNDIALCPSAGNTKEKLTMGEVQSLKLTDAKLVVLSACDTFKGEVHSDGVVGITRAFLVAGTSTVVSSLWPVSDSTTKTLMIRFYNAIISQVRNGHNQQEDGGSSIVQSIDVCGALQEAMVSMLKEKNTNNNTKKYDAKNWAPFLVYGL